VIIVQREATPVESDTLMTQKQVTALARANGFSEKASKIAGAIAMAETHTITGGKSYCDFDKVGDQRLADDTWGYSYSAWQIRSLRADKGTGMGRDEDRLKDPEYAAEMAYVIYRARGYRWTDWSTYNGGAYLSFLLDSPEAVVPAGTTRVQPGDGLIRIGTRTGYPWRDIAKANNLRDPYKINLGQVLLLPDFPHTVTRGETLTSVAAKYGTNLTPDRLAEYNNLALTAKLTIGQTINIPRI